jgi:hypothetical protein
MPALPPNPLPLASKPGINHRTSFVSPSQNGIRTYVSAYVCDESRSNPLKSSQIRPKSPELAQSRSDPLKSAQSRPKSLRSAQSHPKLLKLALFEHTFDNQKCAHAHCSSHYCKLLYSWHVGLCQLIRPELLAIDTKEGRFCAMQVQTLSVPQGSYYYFLEL